MRHLLKWFNRILSTVLVLILISTAGIVLSARLTNGDPEIFGYQLKTVLSGSMEPTILTGSMIAVRSIDGEERTNLEQGTIITYMEEDRLVTHRITEVNTVNGNVMYTTKGDHNQSADANPVLAENVVAVYNGFTIPLLGYLLTFTQTANGSVLFMILPGVLMLGYSIVTIWRTIKEIDQKNSGPIDVK